MARHATANRLATAEILHADMTPSIKWLSQRVADLCETRSQAELGRVTKLGQGAIGRLARREHKNPTLATLDALAAGLSVPAWTLIRPVRDPERTALEDRAFGIVERIPADLLPALLRTLEGLDAIAGKEEDEPPAEAAKPRRLK